MKHFYKRRQKLINESPRSNTPSTPPAFLNSSPPIITPFSKPRKKKKKKVYCICRREYDPSKWMICCDNCEKWYHGQCMRLCKEEESKYCIKFYCHKCKEEDTTLENAWEAGRDPKESNRKRKRKSIDEEPFLPPEVSSSEESSSESNKSKDGEVISNDRRKRRKVSNEKRRYVLIRKYKNGMNCFCGKNEDENVEACIRCDACKLLFHKSCCGIFDEDFVVKSFSCKYCVYKDNAEEDNKKKSELKLLNNLNNLKKKRRYRRRRRNNKDNSDDVSDDSLYENEEEEEIARLYRQAANDKTLLKGIKFHFIQKSVRKRF